MNSFNYYLNSIGEVGLVESVTTSVVGVSGLPSAKPEELVVFESGEQGQVLFLHPDRIEILLFERTLIRVGTRVARTNQRLSIPAGKELMGQLINPLGKVLNHGKKIRKTLETRLLFKDPPGINERTTVNKPLETGVILVDMLIPLGCGQRELIIGDRKTGKTSFLLQTVISQAKKGTVCIWAAIGKKQTEIKQIEDYLTKSGVMDKIIIVAASAEDASGLIYLTPFSAISLAEYFRELGLKSLVILDDLGSHAKFYREMSLLARRFPGRDSYPVDIFFKHAAIMERGGCFRYDGKQVSISVLPVVETNEGDLSGYIQTNLMSMTDGHIFFDRELFSTGRRPAINLFLSVTRVGRQTQTPLNREISRNLVAFLVKYQKLGNYVHFGAELTDEVKAILDKGSQIVDFFNQESSDLIPLNIGVYIFCCLWLDYWQDKKSRDLEEIFSNLVKQYCGNQKFRSLVDGCVKKSHSFEELSNNVKKIKPPL